MVVWLVTLGSWNGLDAEYGVGAIRSSGEPRQPRHSGVSGLVHAAQLAIWAGGSSPPWAQPAARPNIHRHAGIRIERMGASCVFHLQVASNLALSHMAVNVYIFPHVQLYLM